MRLLRKLAALLVGALVSAGACAGTPVRVFATAYPPYVSPELPEQGPAARMLRDILARRGLEARIDFQPWARLSPELAAGRYDLVLLAWPGDLQRHGLIAGTPWFVSRLGLYVRRTDLRPWGLALDEAAGKRIGIVRDYAYPDVLLKSGLKLEMAGSDVQNLRKLMAGRVDAVVMERAVGQHLLTHGEPGLDPWRIAWQEPALAIMPLYAAVVPDRPLSARLQAALAEGLQAYKEEGRYGRLLCEQDLDAPVESARYAPRCLKPR